MRVAAHSLPLQQDHVWERAKSCSTCRRRWALPNPHMVIPPRGIVSRRRQTPQVREASAAQTPLEVKIVFCLPTIQ
eukprot:scaffold297570_cov46-Tisochrysis_lutea.AAC.1